MFALGGVPFLYQGEELGSPNGVIAPEDRHDPISTRNEHGIGRDVTRTVMPWDDSHANGFSASATPWLVAPDRPLEDTVAGQKDDPASWLNRHREMLRVRKELTDLWTADPVWFDAPLGDARALRRGGAIAVTNLGENPLEFELPDGEWRVRFDSRGNVTGDLVRGIFPVAAESTYWLALE